MDSLERKLIKFGAWCGITYLLMFLGGTAGIAGFFPPHPPSADADTIAAIYEADIFRIRVGMIIMMLACVPCLFYVSALSVVLRQIEGRVGILTLVMALGGFALAMLTFYPAIWWLVGAFRPERGAEIIHLFNDSAWLQFIGGLFISWPMFAVLAIGAFVDKRDDPILPRWYGYLAAWTAVLFIPGQLIFFILTGPFAWNGLISFYVPLTAFLFWTLASTNLLLKAAKRPDLHTYCGHQDD